MADDSSNAAKVEEVVIESVQENPEEGKRDISILDEAKKLLQRTKSSSSSSSDSDDEKKKEEEKEKNEPKEEKAKHSFAESLRIGAVPAAIQGFVVNVEEKFNSKFDDDQKEKIHSFVSNVEEKFKSAFKHKKESGESVGEASNDNNNNNNNNNNNDKAVVSEAPIENNPESCEAPEPTPNTTPVTIASLQETSTWKSCCGLIEVLRPSQR